MYKLQQIKYIIILYMGNAISKLCEKVSEYKREREKRKIMKIYQKVFQDDHGMYIQPNTQRFRMAEI